MTSTIRLLAILCLGLAAASAACLVPPGGGPASPGGAAPHGGGVAPAPRAARRVTFNGAALDARGWAALEAIEAHVGGRVADGAYWYDAASGLAGAWGGPAAASLPPGLPLGGPLPAGASGGGDGRLTGVFVNGRELHPLDVAGLAALVGPVPAGRFWLDAHGTFGAEGGPALGNLVQLARRRGGGAWRHGTEVVGGNVWVGGDGAGGVYVNDGSTGCSFANDGGGVIC